MFSLQSFLASSRQHLQLLACVVVLLLIHVVSATDEVPPEDEEDSGIFGFIVGDCFIENGIGGLVQCPLEAAGLFLGGAFFIILCGLGMNSQ